MRSSLCLALALAVGSVAAITAFDAPAQTTKAVRATAEASMVLTGTIDVATDGSVSNLVLDQRERLTPTIAGFVDGTIRSWRFEPTVQDGRAVSVTAPIRVRLLGKPAADGTMEVRMTGVNFNVYSAKDTDTVTRREMGPPSYPQQAFRNCVQGEVVLLIRVDRNGNAADVATEQVNLGSWGPSAPCGRCVICLPMPAPPPPASGPLHRRPPARTRTLPSGRSVRWSATR